MESYTNKQQNAKLKASQNPLIIKTLYEISKTQTRDQNIKIKILVALKNIISTCDQELFSKIYELLQLIQRFVVDPDDSIIVKAKECDEMLKAKVLQFSSEKKKDLSELLNYALVAISENFENENLNIKNWCLGWLSFFLNIDLSLHKQYGKIVISLIQFLHESKNSEISSSSKRLLEQSLSRFSTSTLFTNVDFSIDFLNRLLILYVKMIASDNESAYEKCETILNWAILIAKQLYHTFSVVSPEQEKQNQASLQNSDGNSLVIENIYFNSIVMISTYSKQKRQSIKDKLGEYNEIITMLFFYLNQVLSNSKNPEQKKYKKILSFCLEEMTKADDQTIELLIQWNEQIFQSIKEEYIEHIEKMIKILDNKNDIVNNNVIKFISKIIKQLNNPALTKKIFCYFLQNNKNETGLDGFLKFLKILFNQFPNLPLFLSLISEVSNSTDKSMFPKVVQSFHVFITFEENFAFLRELFNKIKNDKATNEEKQSFKFVLQFWCYDKISLFSLCILAGKYSLAYKVISDFSNENLREKQLLQLTTVAKMLELPYYSQIRIDLLDYQKNYYLVKSLQIVMMILPQSDSYSLLKNRLKCVYYFNSLPKIEIGENSSKSGGFEKELEKVYEDNSK